MLSGRVIVVTGAGRGIGRSVVEQLVERGASVAALDVALDEMPQKDPALVLPLLCDVTDEASVISAFDAIVAHFGRLDGLVNNAGVVLEKQLLETTMAEFDRVVAVNLRGTFLCARTAVSHFRKLPQEDPPRIVNIASELGHSGLAHYSAYTASKGGIFSLTRSLALELAPNILVNTVAPGPTDTPMLQGEEGYEEWKKGEGIPLRRLGTPDDVAKAVCFLMSADARFMTGSTLDVNGGAVMY